MIYVYLIPSLFPSFLINNKFNSQSLILNIYIHYLIIFPNYLFPMLNLDLLTVEKNILEFFTIPFLFLLNTRNIIYDNMLFQKLIYKRNISIR